MSAVVVSVSRSAERGVSKDRCEAIELVAGHGVAGDIHSGPAIRHLARMRRDPTQPNLRQVHLLNAELLDELAARNMPVEPGQMGENVLVRGLDLLAVGTGTVLRFGEAGEVEVTGLRNPCRALDDLHPGLMEATLERAEDGELIRRAGVMGIVRHDGRVCAGDSVQVLETAACFSPLRPV